MAKKKDVVYMCIGESWMRSQFVKMGYCGDSHILSEWLKILFFEYDEEQLDSYFKGKKDKEFVEYIYMVKGKRLVKAEYKEC